MASDAPKSNYIFVLKWMKKFSWVLPVKDDESKAYCALCKKELNISHNGYFSLAQHEKTKKHLRALSENNGEYRHDANNNASTLKPPQFVPTTVECPDRSAGINSDKSGKREIMNDPSIKAVSLINPQAPFPIRKADEFENWVKSVMLTDVSILHKTNLMNRNSTVDERSKSLQNTSETLGSVRNTHKSNNGSRSDVPEINGCLENNSKLTLSDAPKNSFLAITTSRATVSSPHREQPVCPQHKDDNLSDVNVTLEPIQTETKIDKPSSHLSTPSPSKAMEQTDENIGIYSNHPNKIAPIETGTKIDKPSSHLSTPSPSKAMEQTDENIGIYSNHPNSPSTLTGAENTLEETPEVHLLCKASDTEIVCKEEQLWLEEDAIPLRLSEHSNTQRSEIDVSGLSKRRCLPTRELLGRSHSITRDKSFFLNEIRNVFKRLDEAKLVYENECRIIMEDYKILLNKLSEESDPTCSMPEHVSSWNSLILLRMLYNEASISENLNPDCKQNNIDGQHDNGSNSDENPSTSQGLLHNGQIRKRKASHLTL